MFCIPSAFRESDERRVRRLIGTLGLKVAAEESRTIECQYGVVYDAHVVLVPDARPGSRDVKIELRPHDVQELKTPEKHATSVETMMTSLDVIRLTASGGKDTDKYCVAVMPLAMALRRYMRRLSVDMEYETSATSLLRTWKNVEMKVKHTDGSSVATLVITRQVAEEISKRYRMWLRLRMLYDKLDDHQKMLFKRIRFYISEDESMLTKAMQGLRSLTEMDITQTILTIAQTVWLTRMFICMVVKIAMFGLVMNADGDFADKQLVYFATALVGNLMDAMLQTGNFVKVMLGWTGFFGEKVSAVVTGVVDSVQGLANMLSFGFLDGWVRSVATFLMGLLGIEMLGKIMSTADRILSSPIANRIMVWAVPAMSFTITMIHIAGLVAWLIPSVNTTWSIVALVTSAILALAIEKCSARDCMTKLLTYLLGDKIGRLVGSTVSLGVSAFTFSLLPRTQTMNMIRHVVPLVKLGWMFVSPIMSTILLGDGTPALGVVSGTRSFADMYRDGHPLQSAMPTTGGMKLMPPLLSLTSSESWLSKITDPETILRRTNSMAPQVVAHIQTQLQDMMVSAYGASSRTLIKNVMTLENVLQIVVLTAKSVADVLFLTKRLTLGRESGELSVYLTDCTLSSVQLEVMV